MLTETSVQGEVTYYTDLYKEFGLSGKTVFISSEFLPLVSQYPKIHELKSKVDQKNNYQSTLDYYISKESELNTLITGSVDAQKTQYEQELVNILSQKSNIELQISILADSIQSLKTEMGVE